MTQNIVLGKENLKTYEDQDGQLTFSSISTDTSAMVVQSNTMIKGRQDLSLNEAKLVRIIMMQILANDLDFKPYTVSPGEFAMLVGNVDSVNMYHKSKDLCDSLMRKNLEIVSDDGSWVKYNWVSMCRYNSRSKKIEVKLNPDLKPFLLGLVEKGFYTQYTLDNTLNMSSIYAIRIFELLQEAIKSRVLPKNGTKVVLTKDTIINACMIYKQDKKSGAIILGPDKQPVEKYERISQFKEKVIETACREITANTIYYVPYNAKNKEHPEWKVGFIKSGREITAFEFYVNTKYHLGMKI